MNQTDYLIIGGGPAGTSAAEEIRNGDPNGSITILEDEIHPMYSRVRIPFYLRGVKTREELFLRTFESYKEKNINLLNQKSVVKLDTASSKVTTQDGEEFSYKKLVISTGGKPRKLNKYKNEHSMQTVEDADRILEDIKKAKKGVVIGSGFIALEFMETFLHFGLETHLCASAKGYWETMLTKDMSDLVCNIMRASGIKIYFGEVPDLVNDEDTIVGTGIGIDISQGFFPESGLKFDGGITANSYLQTEVPNVFVAGDIAKFHSKKLGRVVRYGNWTNAIASGRAVAKSVLGSTEDFDLLSAYSITEDKIGLSVVFLGFCVADDQTQVISKALSDREGMQLFIRNGKLDGCILVNQPMERQKYQTIIEERQDFTFEP